MGVVQMSQFHRRDYTVDDQRRSESRPQSQKGHLSAFIAAKSLHCRIVDNLYRTPERRLKIVADPALT